MKNFMTAFLQHVQTQPHKKALWVDDQFYTYCELHTASVSFACMLEQMKKNNFVGIYGSKSLHYFSAILACFLTGQGYLPLSPRMPLARTLDMIQQSGISSLFFSGPVNDAVAMLDQFPSLTLLIYDQALYQQLLVKLPIANLVLIIPSSDIANSGFASPNHENYAYLMFTSGSTGSPKGIAVRHRHLNAYLQGITQTYDFHANDHFIQCAEMTFDLSAHEIFICWLLGACLYVYPDQPASRLPDFIDTHQISVWLMVPAYIPVLLKWVEIAKPKLISLRYSFFCGEALAASAASAWQNIIPNAQLANLYGPTETTIGISYCNYNSECHQEKLTTVPIGRPLPGQAMVLVNHHDQPVQAGELGQICLAGTQVTEGYWGDQARSQAVFKRLAWDDQHRRWYTTGDWAYEHPDFGFIYVGRKDDQWQINGQRIEKMEIEQAFRKVLGDVEVTVIAKHHMGQATSLHAVLNCQCDAVSLRKSLAQYLPESVIPSFIYTLPELPKNINGKIDYQKINQIIFDEEKKDLCEPSASLQD